ncbi:MAG: 4-aminobutyrate--2-oxoglutarate transaminase [Candidatus Rokuibacteriota bacterium]|nr:MAG: 4-aminobutyrate--2-oxoglutarate transaminase [Candidatus Rokubacteria bacterium]
MPQVPGPRSRELTRLREQYVARGVDEQHPVFVASTQGATLVDVDGNRYIDFAGGIGALNAGANHPEVVAAVRAQAERMLHASFHVLPYEPYVRLAERLCAITPGRFAKKVMLVNSGAEAVENAVKIARYATGRPGVITFENAFHGRTLLALTLTSRARNRDFGPLAPDVYRCPFPYLYRSGFASEPETVAACLDAFRGLVEEVGADRLAAAILEPVQGEGGFVVPPAAFVQGVAAYCRERGILLIADEIQTGFYRTGRRFGVEHFDVTPDLMALAKSIADGLPLGAVIGRSDLMDAIPPGGLGTTYGGNPVACAAALAVIEVLERDGAGARARALGARLLERFRAWQAMWELIGDVRGLGAMVAMELVTDRRTREPAAEATSAIVAEALREGLVLVKAGAGKNVVRFLGPLAITDAELAEGLQMLERAFSRVCTPVSRSH